MNLPPLALRSVVLMLLRLCKIHLVINSIVSNTVYRVK